MLLSMTGRSEGRPKLTKKLTLELPHMPQRALPREVEGVRTNDPRELAEVVLVLRAKADVAITQQFLMGIVETATMLEFTVLNLARNTSQFVPTPKQTGATLQQTLTHPKLLWSNGTKAQA